MTLENIGCLIWLVESFAAEHKFAEGADGVREREMVAECRDVISALADELPEMADIWTLADDGEIPY